MEKNSRKTKQLEVIWDAIKDDSSHPTADQVYERVRKQLPNISLGTVYRNLQKLVVDEKLQVLILGRLQGISISSVNSAIAYTMSSSKSKVKLNP